MANYVTYDKTYVERLIPTKFCKLCSEQFEGAYCIDCWQLCVECGYYCDADTMVEGEDGLYCSICFDQILDGFPTIKEPEGIN